MLLIGKGYPLKRTPLWIRRVGRMFRNRKGGAFASTAFSSTLSLLEEDKGHDDEEGHKDSAGPSHVAEETRHFYA